MARKTGKMIAAREGEVHDQQRLREALTRHADGFMAALDGAIALRTADQDTSRMRALARTSLQDACLRAMEAFALSKE